MTGTRLSDVIYKWTGWCPNSNTLKVKNHCPEITGPAAGVHDIDDPQTGSNPAVKSQFMDWFTAVAIIILFATPAFGGFFWWPFFVLAVLAAGLVYWHFCVQKRGS